MQLVNLLFSSSLFLTIVHLFFFFILQHCGMHKVKNEGLDRNCSCQMWLKSKCDKLQAMHYVMHCTDCTKVLLALYMPYGYGTGVYVIVFSTLTGVPTTNAQQHYVRIC